MNSGGDDYGPAETKETDTRLDGLRRDVEKGFKWKRSWAFRDVQEFDGQGCGRYR